MAAVSGKDVGLVKSIRSTALVDNASSPCRALEIRLCVTALDGHAAYHRHRTRCLLARHAPDRGDEFLDLMLLIDHIS
jgi:hypothetical protein